MTERRLEVGQRDGLPSLSGELDISVASELADCLAQLAAAGDGRVDLDLSAVTFMDSTALGAFGQRAAALREEGSRLVLHGLTEHLRRLFEITNLESLVELVD